MYKITNYISILAVPFIIVVILIFGILDKKKIYDIFLVGAKEGMSTVVKIFPTLVGIFVAVGCLRSSGILEIISNNLSVITKFINFPSEVVPLTILRPISGSASLGVAMDIMKNYGVDSKIRTNYSNNNGFDRNYILYNCSIYRKCWNKKDKICLGSSTNR